MKRDPKTIVEFGFMMKNYWREEPGVHEVKGRKTLKLFISWFKLAKKTGRLLYGGIKFVDSGEMWIWQNPNRVYRGGWQQSMPSKYEPKQLELKIW